MKIESMRARSHRSFKIDADVGLPAEARERLSAIRRHGELRGAGCAAPAATGSTAGRGAGSMATRPGAPASSSNVPPPPSERRGLKPAALLQRRR